MLLCSEPTRSKIRARKAQQSSSKGPAKVLKLGTLGGGRGGLSSEKPHWKPLVARQEQNTSLFNRHLNVSEKPRNKQQPVHLTATEITLYSHPKSWAPLPHNLPNRIWSERKQLQFSSVADSSFWADSCTILMEYHQLHLSRKASIKIFNNICF